MSNGPTAEEFAQMTQRMLMLERRVAELVTDSVLVEAWVLQIRQSCHVQLARVEAYLDAVVLAAEQVQDKRIEQLETPKEVTGWEYFGNVLLTLFLESTLPGKFLVAASKAIFTPILRACYGLWTATVTKRWSIRQAKARKCKPATTSGNRS